MYGPNIVLSFTCLGSISSTFYVHLLHTQIPRAQKNTDNLTEFLRFWNLKKLCKNMLVKSTPDQVCIFFSAFIKRYAFDTVKMAVQVLQCISETLCCKTGWGNATFLLLKSIQAQYIKMVSWFWMIQQFFCQEINLLR